MKKKAFAKSHLQEGVREKCKQKPKQALFCELLYTHCTGSSVVRAYLWLAKTSQDFNDNWFQIQVYLLVDMRSRKAITCSTYMYNLTKENGSTVDDMRLQIKLLSVRHRPNKILTEWMKFPVSHAYIQRTQENLFTQSSRKTN